MPKTTGNSVADYKAIKETCSLCDGSGQLFPNTKDDLRKAFYQTTTLLDFAMIREALRDWRVEGRIKCFECNGKGYEERWL